jgi:hypothetical protein
MNINGTELAGLIVSIVAGVLSLLNHLHLFQHNRAIQQIEAQLPPTTPADPSVIPGVMGTIFQAVMGHTHAPGAATTAPPPAATTTTTAQPPGGTPA